MVQFWESWQKDMKATTNIIIHLRLFVFSSSLLGPQCLLVCVNRNRQIYSIAFEANRFLVQHQPTKSRNLSALFWQATFAYWIIISWGKQLRKFFWHTGRKVYSGFAVWLTRNASRSKLARHGIKGKKKQWNTLFVIAPRTLDTLNYITFLIDNCLQLITNHLQSRVDFGKSWIQGYSLHPANG